jgi:hypothetical protein
MANLFRNELTIEGENIQRVLDFIGFQKPSLIEELGVVLIDFPPIVPMPAAAITPEWARENWGGSPYDGYIEGDLFELTDRKVAFKFFTKHAPVEKIIFKLAERFSELKFTYAVHDTVNEFVGGMVLENGTQALFVDLHLHPIPVADEEECPNFVCDVQNCSILFPAPTSEQLEHYRKLRGQDAIRMMEEFGAEVAL